MVKRTSHGEDRHADAGRQTSEAASDKATANEIYLDIESGNYIFIGQRGRSHVFTADGQHHTSFRTRRGKAGRILQSKKVFHNVHTLWKFLVEEFGVKL
jgi:hypothetical protein